MTAAGAADAPAPVMAYVSAGSNIEPERHLRLAVSQLRAHYGPLQLSSVYRSRAAGFPGADFLNLVAGFATRETPAAIVAGLERLHMAAGRVRGAARFAPRTLDLDLLLYGDQVCDAPQIPRRDITEYSFVLGPLAEIAPQLRHPVSGATMAELWERFDQASHPIHRVALEL
ncbi:MAG: 2-amino-4-hydroxy-6-hydroxymethyldihydropteridine diphosphokinase [Gammaproteobacteria bacterium]|nr:MAG: 2-amino-4-hydroxy-6-hydroxymethyldihydropteridine diphosphokinase [Gammaproteobacteria bacterium]